MDFQYLTMERQGDSYRSLVDEVTITKLVTRDWLEKGINVLNYSCKVVNEFVQY